MVDGTSQLDDDGESIRETKYNDGVDWKRGLVSGFFALVIGGLGAWATSQLGLALPAFVILGGLSAYYLYKQPIATKSAAIGFYIMAGVGITVPLLFYIPMILTPGEGAEGAGTFIGSILGFFIWGALFAVFALLAAAIGYFVNKRASKKLDAIN